MKIKNIIKKQTTIIAIAVVLVTIAVIGVSYAIFFDVKSNTQNQVITAGNLALTISEINALSVSKPKTTAEGLASTPLTYTVQNTASNLPASYSIYIYAGSGNQVPLNNIKISTDGNATSGSTSRVLSEITDTLIESGTTYYRINQGTLEAGATGAAQYLRVWVDEDTLGDELNAALDLQLYIVSEVAE